jgi:thiamine kinase-like enzyme
LAQRFADRTFFETLRVEPYYQYSALQAPAAAEFYRRLIDDTRATRTALVHGDYSPKNVLVHAARLVLIDHEVIHWGDPAFDVGFALTHLLSKAHHLPAQRATLAAAANAWWEAYREAASEPAPGEIVPPGVASGGLPICAERCARHALGCLLARVAGRSPLEYLTAPERDRQRRAVLRLIERVPGDVPELIDRFIHEIAR